ncbi:MAG: xanthine dehydrogenase family protein molybdopterin-binding subunit [Thaumarchaeota archaeon]|nr:xanthine dehydrogenase family protein molybdopterin-binding subunit [Nitrososphaerota archaeon]
MQSIENSSLPRRKWIGARVKRKEDRRFLLGRGMFLDDMKLDGMLRVAVLRSPYAHAKIGKIDTTRASELTGVVAILTGREMSGKATLPGFMTGETKAIESVMATNKVRYVGQPVAAVAAETKAVAEDALDLIQVEYEPLPEVIDPEVAMGSSAPVVFEQVGSNILLSGTYRYGDLEGAFKQADLVIKKRFSIHRHSSTPLELTGILSYHNPTTGILTIWGGSPRFMEGIGKTGIGPVPGDMIRVRIGDRGGAFGTIYSIREDMFITALLSIKTARPVKYIEDRTDMMVSGGQSHSGVYYAEMALKKDGTILGFKVRDICDEGAAAGRAGYWIAAKLTNIVGMYSIKNIELEGYSIATNTTPTGSDRGPGKPHMAFVLERMVDIAAKKLGIDQDTIRLKNLIQPNEMPYMTPSGNLYESGDFPEVFRKALEKFEYPLLRKEQQEARRQGKYLGIGIGCSVDAGAANPGREALLAKNWNAMAIADKTSGATVMMNPLGRVSVLLASDNAGQSHETTASQIVADELGVSPDDVDTTEQVDTLFSPWTFHSGSGANVYSAVDIGAIVGAARKVRQKIVKIAAHFLDAKPEEIELADGNAYVKSATQRSVSLKKIAWIAYHKQVLLPNDVELGLHETYFYRLPHADFPDEKHRVKAHLTYGGQAHVAAVEVDIETGKVKVLKYVIAHDVGVTVNPAIVEGQVHGNVNHMISVALGEGHRYNANGQLLTRTFMDYLPPTAVDSNDIESVHLEYPSPYTVLGTKPLGEGPATCPLATIANAVEDALSPFDIQIRDIPITAERILLLVKKAKGEN